MHTVVTWIVAVFAIYSMAAIVYLILDAQMNLRDRKRFEAARLAREERFRKIARKLKDAE